MEQMEYYEELSGKELPLKPNQSINCTQLLLLKVSATCILRLNQPPISFMKS